MKPITVLTFSLAIWGLGCQGSAPFAGPKPWSSIGRGVDALAAGGPGKRPNARPQAWPWNTTPTSSTRSPTRGLVELQRGKLRGGGARATDARPAAEPGRGSAAPRRSGCSPSDKRRPDLAFAPLLRCAGASIRASLRRAVTLRAYCTTRACYEEALVQLKRLIESRTGRPPAPTARARRNAASSRARSGSSQRGRPRARLRAGRSRARNLGGAPWKIRRGAIRESAIQRLSPLAPSSDGPTRCKPWPGIRRRRARTRPARARGRGRRRASPFARAR